MIPLTGADISYQIFDYYAKIAFGLRGLRPESYDITIFSPVRNSAFAVIRLLDIRRLPPGPSFLSMAGCSE